jgi:hypothetical protein
VRRRAELARQSEEAIPAARGEDEARAEPGEATRDRRADARRSAGDEDDQGRGGALDHRPHFA